MEAMSAKRKADDTSNGTPTTRAKKQNATEQKTSDGRRKARKSVTNGQASRGARVVAAFLQSGMVEIGEFPRDFDSSSSLKFCLFRVFTRALEYYQTRVIANRLKRRISLNEIRKGFKIANIQYNASKSASNVREVLGVIVRGAMLFGVDIDFCKLTGKTEVKQALAALLESDEKETEYGWPRFPDGGELSIPETLREGLEIEEFTRTFSTAGEAQAGAKVPVFPLRPIMDEDRKVTWESALETKGIPNSEYDGRALPLLPIVREKMQKEIGGALSADTNADMDKGGFKPLATEEVRDCIVWIQERWKWVQLTLTKGRKENKQRKGRFAVEGDGRLWWRHTAMPYSLKLAWELDDRRAPIFYSSLESLIVTKLRCTCNNLLSCPNRCGLLYALYIASEAVAFLRRTLQLTWSLDGCFPPRQDKKITAAFLCLATINVCKQLGFHERVVRRSIQRILKGLEAENSDNARDEADMFRLMKEEVTKEIVVGKKVYKPTCVKLLSKIFNRELRLEIKLERMRRFVATLEELTTMYELPATPVPNKSAASEAKTAATLPAGLNSG